MLKMNLKSICIVVKCPLNYKINYYIQVFVTEKSYNLPRFNHVQITENFTVLSN